MKESIEISIRDIITDGVALREVLYILSAYLAKEKDIYFYEFEGVWRIASAIGIPSSPIFTHVSLATVIEFALKYEKKTS